MRHRRSARAFTLVELMVSLVAGVLVSLAVIGIARSSTQNFHEQARIANVEGSLRIASERLRADLTRAGFLSTPNIQLDPKVCHSNDPSIINTPFLTTAGPALTKLQSIQIGVGASKAGTQAAVGLAGLNNLNPDDIIIGGDFTTEAEYGMALTDTMSFQFDWNPATQTGASHDANVTAWLNPPASADTIIKNSFRPGGIANFFRAVDAGGQKHFGVVSAAGFAGTTGTVTPDSTQLAPNGVGPFVATGTNSCAVNTQSGPVANMSHNMRVAPVQRVRWYLAPETNPRIDADPALGEGSLGSTGTTQKFNLYRQMLNVNGAADPALPPQIVAEYAIDMKFGITIQSPDTLALTIIDMDNTGTVNGMTTAGVTAAVSGITNISAARYTTTGPQNVKSVRFRLALRTPIADRRYNLPITGGPNYKLRYCINATCTQYARVRTIVTEVALVAQNSPIFCVGPPNANQPTRPDYNNCQN